MYSVGLSPIALRAAIMLCADGERSLATPVMLCPAANVATAVIMIILSTEVILFMACLIFELEEKIVAAAFSATATRVG